MIYECDKCQAALPAGIMFCPRCGDQFEEAVPGDAQLPNRGFTAKPARSAPVATPQPLAAPQGYSQFSAPPPPAPQEAVWNRNVGGPVALVLLLIGGVAFLIFGANFSSPPRHDSPGAAVVPLDSATPSPGSSGASPPDAGAPDTSTPVADAPQLRLGSENFTKQDDYDIVSGEVTNISGEAIASVEAVTTFYDGAGNVVSTEDALIDFNPIGPGQTSPYKTMGEDNPLIRTEKTVFQVMGGAKIETTSAPPPADFPPVDADSSDADASPADAGDPALQTAAPGSGLSDKPLSRDTVCHTRLTEGDLEGKSLSALSISYNTIYAVHGYVFKRRSLRSVFTAKSWYHPDPSFSESELTGTEKTNLKTIRAFEKARFGY